MNQLTVARCVIMTLLGVLLILAMAIMISSREHVKIHRDMCGKAQMESLTVNRNLTVLCVGPNGQVFYFPKK